MKVSLVLGSGGARGYAHMGVIDELLERGHHIASISGCSMGALVGGMYAAGALKEFRDFAEPLKRSEVFRYADLSVGGPGLFKSSRLMDKLHSLVGDIRIEDLPIPYTAVATDLTNRREVWFHDGPLLTAIRASIAIPSAITPVVYRGRLLADGGILNPLPVDASSHIMSEATVAVSLFGHNRPGVGVQNIEEKFQNNSHNSVLPWRGPTVFRRSPSRGHTKNDAEWSKSFETLPKDLSTLDMMVSSLEVMQAALELPRLAVQPPDVLVSVPADVCTTFDFDRARHVAHVGRRLAAEAFDRAGL